MELDFVPASQSLVGPEVGARHIDQEERIVVHLVEAFVVVGQPEEPNIEVEPFHLAMAVDVGNLEVVLEEHCFE